jgi:hypothetical protein
VPIALDDEDGARDGYEIQAGTSFSAPMVSAAIAWIRAARPRLHADQAADVVRFSARDVGRRGYDVDTGYGVLSVGRALGYPKGPHDPGEPNDAPGLVDGSLLGLQPALFRGGRAHRVGATLDAIEDPADWYRVSLGAHRVAHATLRPRWGNPNLELRGPGPRHRRLARSRRAGRRTDRLTIRNRAGRRRTFLVGVAPGRGRRLDAGYVLRVAR